MHESKGKITEALAMVLAVAVVGHEIGALLAPLAPVLIVLAVLFLLYRLVIHHDH